MGNTCKLASERNITLNKQAPERRRIVSKRVARDWSLYTRFSLRFGMAIHVHNILCRQRDMTRNFIYIMRRTSIKNKNKKSMCGLSAFIVKMFLVPT